MAAAAAGQYGTWRPVGGPSVVMARARSQSATLRHTKSRLRSGSDHSGTAPLVRCTFTGIRSGTPNPSDVVRPRRKTAVMGSEYTPEQPVVLLFPFRGRWLVQNSPADRVPSHGTMAFGSSYAIDFVPVDEQGRSAPRSLRSFIRSEPVEVFVGFGRPILSPINGTVVRTLDGEPDHEGRRSQLTLVPYMLTQGRRVRAGPAGIAGNHIVVAISPAGPFVLLAHLRRHSVQVSPGELVSAGQQLAACGNSGNSTEPHLHVQVSDSTDWDGANGVPLAFQHRSGATWIPDNTEIVDA